MNRDKAQYEELIRSSVLFSVEKGSTAFKREALKMVEILYLYVMSDNSRKYKDMGLEITETAMSCIRTYDPEKGDFLNYFNSAMANAARRAVGARKEEEIRSGITMSRTDRKQMRAVAQYLQSHGVTDPDRKQLEILAEVLRIPPARIREIICMNKETAVLSSDAPDGTDGSEMDILVGIPTYDRYDFLGSDADGCMEMLDRIQAAFEKCQKRQQPVVSAAMTAKIAPVIRELGVDTEPYTFLSPEILAMETPPTQREIASMLGKNEASVSRTLREFTAKIR